MSIVQTLVADPSGESSVYAGAYGPVLFNLREDHWEKVADGTGSVFVNVNAVAVVPQNPRTIYVGVSSTKVPPLPPTGAPTGGIYKSTDGGQTWLFTDVHQGDPVFSIAVDPLNEGTVYAVASICSCGPPIYCNRFGPSCSGRIYKSRDSGLTWAHQGTLDGVRALAVDPLATSTLYALAEPGAVFKSLDGGSTWAAANLGFSGQCGAGSSFVIAPSDPKTLYLTASSSCPAAVYKTINGALTWQATALTTAQVGVPVSIAVDPTKENVVYLAATETDSEGGGGLFRSLDGGENWSRFDEGLPDPDIDLVAVDRDGAAVHVSIFQKGVFDYTYVPPLRARVRAIRRSQAATTLPAR